MTSDNRTPEEIEREIEIERAELTDTLDTLQDKLSIDGIINQVSDQFRNNGSEIASNIARTARENPVALALTGVGLAWMIFGSAKRPDAANVDGSYTPASRQLTHQPRRDAAGARLQNRHDNVPVYSTNPSWAKDDDNDGPGKLSRAGDAISGAAGSARDSVTSAGRSAKDTATSAGRAAYDTAASAGASVRDGVSSAGQSVADAARSGASSVASSASALGSRIAEGTETLSEAARERVITARRKAIVARRDAERALSHGADRAADFYDRQPLVAGLIAMAAGAAIAGALPRTKFEDEHMGQYSDDLMHEADRIFREETEKAKNVASAAADEAAKIADETKRDLDSGAPGDKSAAQAIGDKLKSSGQRVAEAARDEAKSQKLGEPST